MISRTDITCFFERIAMKELYGSCPTDCHEMLGSVDSAVPQNMKAGFSDFLNNLKNSIGWKAALGFVTTHVPQIIAAMGAAATGNFGPLGVLVAEAIMTPAPTPA